MKLWNLVKAGGKFAAGAFGGPVAPLLLAGGFAAADHFMNRKQDRRDMAPSPGASSRQAILQQLTAAAAQAPDQQAVYRAGMARLMQDARDGSTADAANMATRGMGGSEADIALRSARGRGVAGAQLGLLQAGQAAQRAAQQGALQAGMMEDEDAWRRRQERAQRRQSLLGGLISAAGNTATAYALRDDYGAGGLGASKADLLKRKAGI